MDALNARLEEMMPGQQNPTHVQTMPAPAPASNLMVRAKPQPFDGTHGTAAEVFVGQIGLHAVTYPELFPTDARKVVFAVLFMKDYAATWSQLYLDKVFNNQWSLMTSSTISDSASLITLAGTVPRWPCGTSTRLEPCRPTHRTSTSMPALWVGPTSRYEPLPARPQGEHPACRGRSEN
ncbi:uncharacterized protein VP01_9169g1 [Puccinia sorghi]|uniref:Retrotransposon gag domain-containing protein n=1 Tax=Puccinia sorghi TaxID=27349 RepID=A0A0L6U7F3_9BASI|nr:uncharacterized protein VP01_9169g1 [Puccinia sorghi]